MTISILPPRVLPLRFLTRATTTTPIFSLIRVRNDQNAHHQTSSSACNEAYNPFRVNRSRSYATDTPVHRPGKPKAHTGRATASKRKTTTTASTSASSATGTAAAKKPAAQKAAKRTTKAKPERSTKAKAKPKPKPRKVLTEKQKADQANKAAVLKQRELRKAALLKPPKKLPSTAYVVISSESYGKGETVNAAHARAIADKYKNLTLEERERANHIANENKVKNEIAYKKWLATFTPTQVREANVARDALKRQAKAEGKKATFPHIQDERLVKRPTTSYAFFLQDRVSSGDMQGMQVSEVGKLVGREWKELSAGDRKKYIDKQTADQARYIEEYKTVYGVDPPGRAGKKS